MTATRPTVDPTKSSEPEPRRFGGFIAPMSHLDLTFMGTMEETLSRGCKIFARALELLDRYEDFRFFVEYVIFLEAFSAYHPELSSKLTGYVKDGRVQLGAEWSGIMVTTEEEEDLIRNVLLAKLYVLEHYGIDLDTLQLTDIPGVVPQLPQVCRELGIRHLVLTRCAPADQLFWYVGPDESEVLVWSADGYNQAAAFGAHTDKDAMEKSGLAAHLSACKVPPLLFYGSDLYLPAEALIRASTEFSGCHPETPVQLTTPSGYFSSLPYDLIENAPRVSGTLPSTWVYQEPCHANITRLDSVATAMLTAAERWATLAWLRVGLVYPSQELGDLWKMLLRGRDHNFAGRGAEVGQARKLAERRSVRHRAELVRDRSLAAIAERTEVAPGSVPVVVFNVLNWLRTDMVKAHVTLYPGETPSEHDVLADADDLELRGPDGALVPFQVTGDRRHTLGELEIAFVAKDVPSLGYSSYTMRTRDPLSRPATSIDGNAPRTGVERWFGGDAAVLAIDAGKLRAEVDRLSGRTRLLERDGQHWRPLLEDLRLEGRTEPPEVLRQPVRGLSFDDPSREQVIKGRLRGEEAVRILAEGPVFCTVAIRSWIGETPCELRLRLCRDRPTLDVEADVAWDIQHFGRIELVFVTGEQDAQVTYGLPFGASTLAGEDLKTAQQQEVVTGSGPVRRDESTRSSWESTREICRWLDIGNARRGLVMATDHRWTRVEEAGPGDAKFAVRCCLVRGGRMWSGDLDNGMSSSIPLFFRFRFLPHLGSWQKARAPRYGWELVQPLVAYTVNDTLSPKALPPEDSMVSVSPHLGLGDPIVTCLKQGIDGESVVLRWYESTGEACEVEVRGDVLPTNLEHVDLLERRCPHNGQPGSAAGGRYRVRPWKITTLAGHPHQTTAGKVP